MDSINKKIILDNDVRKQKQNSNDVVIISITKTII